MSTENPISHSNKLALVYGALLLRLWLAVHAIQTGMEKYSGVKASGALVEIDGKANEYGLTAAGSVKSYALDHYHGIPEELMKKFEAEPLVVKFALPVYDRILGPALIVLGVMILLGIASRTSLFLLGLLYITLTWGLILINRNEGVAWLGTHMVLIVMALMLAGHNRLVILRKW